MRTGWTGAALAMAAGLAAAGSGGCNATAFPGGERWEFSHRERDYAVYLSRDGLSVEKVAIRKVGGESAPLVLVPGVPVTDAPGSTWAYRSGKVDPPFGEWVTVEVGLLHLLQLPGSQRQPPVSLERRFTLTRERDIFKVDRPMKPDEAEVTWQSFYYDESEKVPPDPKLPKILARRVPR
jgi:hypothetical protein